MYIFGIDILFIVFGHKMLYKYARENGEGNINKRWIIDYGNMNGKQIDNVGQLLLVE